MPTLKESMTAGEYLGAFQLGIISKEEVREVLGFKNEAGEE